MRVLITGSRTWHDAEPIRAALAALLPERSWLTVVHGGALTGADYHANQWVADYARAGFRVEAERHPANWRDLGKRAGMVRNALMVDMGADLCLAFIRDNSRGATHCAALAEKAGIETRITRWPAPTVHEGGTDG